MERPRVGVAVLTMGNRPAELRALLNSVAKQDEKAARIVVVGNGTPLPDLPDEVSGVELPENLGESGGRNVALERHAVYYRMTARNRVWLARRHLPAPLMPVYLGTWTLLTLARTRSVGGLRAWAAGFVEGVREPCGPRRPMRWATVWRMTHLGRPPII
ncbi:hypothetical protein DT019_15285 [Streptomyces sp. SDr-06]|uniref:glycosyltransferase family 2 protein n=1 Tax=Streptomyces sp. SDr-06 TaxID=2267702 RepID=UPI000DE832C9|nr:hypothetical protein [Streptomyces sp. SDr-06]RCH67631.1 hypothetical protein DT019_15285 [Streptomyces sp. SDr-06]